MKVFSRRRLCSLRLCGRERYANKRLRAPPSMPCGRVFHIRAKEFYRLLVLYEPSNHCESQRPQQVTLTDP